MHALRLWRQTVRDGTTAFQPDVQLLQPAQCSIIWLLALTVIRELMTLAAGEDPATVQNGYAPTASPCRTQKPFPHFTLLCVVALARVAVALSVGVGILRDGQVLRDLWLLPLRDCFGLVFWLLSFAGDTIVWRGERFRLRDGRLSRVS